MHAIRVVDIGGAVLEAVVTKFFEHYAEQFNQGLRGQVDYQEVADNYCSEFIVASPGGVSTGSNDAKLLQVIEQGYAHYRSLGTAQMKVRQTHVDRIDEFHCIAHVAWTAVYERDSQADQAIDFEVHYLVQILGGIPRIFGWISGDEEKLLKEHGIG